MLWVISFFIDNATFLIIKDLFWYSLVLNGSFIIYVLVLNIMFEYSWKNYYEYVGYIISRVSYLCSLWGLIYIIKIVLNKTKFLFFYRVWENNKKTAIE